MILINKLQFPQLESRKKNTISKN